MSHGPDSYRVPVLYEDNHLLVVVKPVNMPSQEDDSHDLDLLTLLKEDIKRIYDKPGSVYLGLVHRLDRPVGGAMVFAKTSKAASRLSDMVRRRSMRKVYYAVAHQSPPKPQGSLRHYLLKDTKTNQVCVVEPAVPGAKEALLDYQVVGRQQEAMSLIQVELHTGRPHQIRVQLASIGCPLYGDQKYGLAYAKTGQQIALWSTLLSFPHPVRQEDILIFRSYPPKDQEPWSLWELHKLDTLPNK